MAAMADETGKIPRVPNWTWMMRFIMVGLGLAGILNLYLGLDAEIGLSTIVLSALVGWYYQKRYDQETNEGIANETMYIKRGEKSVPKKS